MADALLVRRGMLGRPGKVAGILSRAIPNHLAQMIGGIALGPGAACGKQGCSGEEGRGAIDPDVLPVGAETSNAGRRHPHQRVANRME